MLKALKLTVLTMLMLIIAVTIAQQVKPDIFVYDWNNRRAPVPDTHIYQTQYLGGTLVKFDHSFHSDGLGLECIECHHVEGCGHCHRKDVTTIDVQESKVALHTMCFTCHADMSCMDCHKQ